MPFARLYDIIEAMNPSLAVYFGLVERKGDVRRKNDLLKLNSEHTNEPARGNNAFSQTLIQ